MLRVISLLLLCSFACAQTGTGATVNVSGVKLVLGQLVVAVWPGEVAWREKGAASIGAKAQSFGPPRREDMKFRSAATT